MDLLPPNSDLKMVIETFLNIGWPFPIAVDRQRDKMKPTSNL